MMEGGVGVMKNVFACAALVVVILANQGDNIFGSPRRMADSKKPALLDGHCEITPPCFYSSPASLVAAPLPSLELRLRALLIAGSVGTLAMAVPAVSSLFSSSSFNSFSPSSHSKTGSGG